MGKTLLVLGAQWGDEGKGKITNYLSEKAEVVIRYQGGNNAGHTIVFNNHKYKLSSIPSGVFDENVKCVIAHGVVLNPRAFIVERNQLIEQGFACNNIYISDRCHIIFDHHLELDRLNEDNLKDKKIGTTKKGIGPCYTDKTARIGMRMCDFVGPNFKQKYKDLLEIKNQQIRSLNGNEIDYEKTVVEYQELADIIRPMVTDTITLINDAKKQGKNILFEGAQGSLLDIDYGSYPYVTSSHVTSGGVLCGSGIGCHGLDEVLGIVKAYQTRVGEGAFPTELLDEIGNEIREKGNEYGTVTRRPRRIGYLDLVALKYSVLVNGITSICLTLLDVLTGFKEIKACVAYEYEGKIINTLPASDEVLHKCKPIYKTFKGWNEDISNVKSFDELPENAKEYIRFIEHELEVPVDVFSVGADKLQTIVRKELF